MGMLLGNPDGSTNLVLPGQPQPQGQLGQMDQGFVNRFNTQNTRFGGNGGAGAAINAGQSQGFRRGATNGTAPGMGRTQARMGMGAGMLGSARVGMGVGDAQKRFGGGVMPGYGPQQNAVQQARMSDAARQQMGAQMMNNPQNAVLGGYMMGK